MACIAVKTFSFIFHLRRLLGRARHLRKPHSLCPKDSLAWPGEGNSLQGPVADPSGTGQAPSNAAHTGTQEATVHGTTDDRP